MSSINCTDYRLGNIIDAWYAEALVGKKPRGIEALSILAGNHPDSFGGYLLRNPPRYTQRLSAATEARLLEYWWIYDYGLIRELSPGFALSLRDAVTQYFGRRDDAHDDGTCVVHYRIGDIFAPMWNFGVVTVESLASAVSRFSRVPSRFDILPSGINHGTDAPLRQKSNQLLEGLASVLRARYPKASVNLSLEPGGADAQFFTLVSAPMLLAATGSYATAAAIANPNERLTPAVRYLLMADKSDEQVRESRILENWWTYPVQVAPPGASAAVIMGESCHSSLMDDCALDASDASTAAQAR